jgi:IS605 OrfB family transposase
MIRSTKVTTKFSNPQKQQQLNDLLNEYKRVVQSFVDLLWTLEKVPTLLDKELTSQINSWLSARLLQCAGKQASGIVRGTQARQKKRLKVIEKLNQTGKYKQARKLQAIHNKKKVSQPLIKNIQIELDERFVKVQLENPTSFDGWVTLTSLGDKLKLILPFRKTKHFNQLVASGQVKAGIRLSGNAITFIFDLPDVQLKETGQTIGIDIGQTTALSVSTGEVSRPNQHRHDLQTITTQLSRKKKGSKGFQRAVAHRTNYINWSINQLNLSAVKQINIENIKQLRLGKRTSRSLSHWTYTTFADQLERVCERQGVLVNKVNPTYTSQRCSQCGYTRRGNRSGKLFKCRQCGYTFDADLNAAVNLSLKLRPIGKQQRQKQISRTGFYWLAEGQEHIVPDVERANFYIFL